jgi:predicted O-methyltransferase YrrM
MSYNLEIEGWMHEVELQAIEQLATRVPANGVIVEVGSWCGRSAVAWATSADPSVTVFCFDPFYRWDDFEKNTKQFSNIVPVKGLVPSESTYEDSRKIDIVFIDAGHHNPNDWEIISHFLPFIKPGGYIAGHDYTTYRNRQGIEYPDVNLNVHRLEELFDQKAKINDSLWWFKKPLEGNFNTDMYTQLDTPNE